VKNVIKQKKL